LEIVAFGLPFYFIAGLGKSFSRHISTVCAERHIKMTFLYFRLINTLNPCLAYEPRAFFVFLGRLFSLHKSVLLLSLSTPRILEFISVFLAILVAYKFALKMIYGLLAQTLPKKANVQGVGTFIYLICALTSGFVIYPLAIPSYLHWLFWINPSEWQRAIVA
jgi:hypothetical protein